jgi:hypothetical protein
MSNQKIPTWKVSGFKSEAEYDKYMRDKMDKFLNKIESSPELMDVFKRLNDR